MVDIEYSYEISFSTVLWCVRRLRIVGTSVGLLFLKNQCISTFMLLEGAWTAVLLI